MSTVLATSSYHIEEIQQESQKAIKDRDIRRFCALTPYKHSEKLCQATQINFSNSNATWLKIMEGNKMVGTAMLQFENGWDHVILQHLLIQPEYRKRGIGTKTVNYIKSRAEQVTLNASTAKNVEFYRARGFNIVMEAQQAIQIMSLIRTGRILPSAPNKPYPVTLMSTTNMSVEEAFNLSQKYSM